MKEQAKNGIRPAQLSLVGDPKAPNGVGSVAATATGGGGSHAGVAVVAAPSGDDSKSVISSCSCCHGGHCTCAVKKEPGVHLDAVPEFSEPPVSCGVPTTEVRPKPRLHMTHSESSLTTFANGHHKPTHKHHTSVHGSCPYSIPTVGHSGHTFGEHNGCIRTKSGSGSSSTSSHKTSRRIKSEQSSPDLRTYPALQMANHCITPLELTPRPTRPAKPALNRTPSGRTGLSLNTNSQTFSTLHDFPSQELLPPSADSENGYQFSAGLYSPQSAGWPPSFPQYESTASFDEPLNDPPRMDLETFLRLHAPPALTNSTSGDEREDMGVYGGLSPPYGFDTGPMSSSSSDHTESEQYQLSAASSYVGLPQMAEMAEVNNGFDTEFLSTVPLPPASGIDTFEAGLVAGADGLFDAGDMGLGNYGSMNFSELNMSSDHLAMASKGMDAVSLGSPSAIPPQPDDGDYLWMAPFNGTL